LNAYVKVTKREHLKTYVKLTSREQKGGIYGVALLEDIHSERDRPNTRDENCSLTAALEINFQKLL